MSDILTTLDQIDAQAARVAESATVEPAQPVVKPVAESATERAALDHIATYEGDQISAANIFGAEGQSLTQKPQMTPSYAVKLRAAVQVYKELVQGQRSLRSIQESMMSSEFSNLFGDTLDRVVLARYATYQPTYRQFLRGRTVADFRTVKGIRLSGGERLTSVAEGTQYPEDTLSESAYSYSVGKYGKQYNITWEMMVNDDLDAFASMPDRMAQDAIQTEMYLATSLYAGNTTLFATNHSFDGSTYSNKDTAALAKASLQAAISNMLKYPSGDAGKPLMNNPVYLVVPPALEMTAIEILGSAMIQYSGGDSQTGIASVAYGTNNPLAGRVQIIVDPYIPIVQSSNQHTSWYLFADPSVGHGAEYAFLRGHEQPQLFMRSPNAIRMGGGTADADFDTDTLGYKVRHVFGGSHANAVGGWRYCYWSDGSA